VEELLSPDVPSVAYERAGIGWSEPAVAARTGAEITSDLAHLLEALDASPPYVLVAHSAGALYARLFQAAHSRDVAGIVFVDGVDGDTYESGRRELRPFERVLAEAQQLIMPKVMALADAVGLVAVLARRGEPDPSIASDPDLVEAHRARWRGRNVLAGSRAEGRQLRNTARDVAGLGDLGSLPITVVYAGESRGFFRRIQQTWTETQKRLAALSTRSELVAAPDAGHFIQLERPDIIADAIDRIVASVRHNPPGQDVEQVAR
jgi:pimeloyl-ACP methyl ester carboxylesterase